MSFQEKNGVVSIISGLGSSLIVGWVIWTRYFEADPGLINDYSFWGKSFLLFMAITVGVRILATILFNIVHYVLTREDDPVIDERDKLIEGKANTISFWIFALGFITGMASLALGREPYMLIVALLGGGLVSDVTSEILKLLFYRRGLQ